MPKSYINTQPGAMRALLNNFDPHKQVYNRLLSLMLTGHATDKIEMIVLWWTWDVYPKKYKIEFVKGLYDACNHFSEFLSQIEIDYTNPKAARWTKTEDIEINYPKTLEESLENNEKASNRIIGLTLETRPEYVDDENCQLWRDLWVTRIEMWIQTLHDSVHIANKRGHDNSAIVKAMHKLRQYGFKISNHYMPGLYTSTPEMDLETFSIAFEHPGIKSDEMKFYPTAVIPNTPLYDLWKSGEYKPLDNETVEMLIRETKLNIIPPYARIKRLARDFDTNEVVAWANTPNMRQLAMKKISEEFAADEAKRAKQYERLWPNQHIVSWIWEFFELLKSIPETTSKTSMDWRTYDADDTVITGVVAGEETFCTTSQQREFVCLCTRCREVRHKIEMQWESVVPVLRAYRSSNWWEIFCSFEDVHWYLYGFLRLLLPDEWTTIDYPWLGVSTAMIRELHVYGTVQKVATDNSRQESSGEKTAQHWWYWTRLLDIATQLSTLWWYSRLSVISGVWVKWYYQKKWFEREWTYMVKHDL